VVHQCYRDSALVTFPLAVSRLSQGQFVLRRADALVTTSRFSDVIIRRLVQGISKTHVIPDFGATRLRFPAESGHAVMRSELLELPTIACR
jgi:hypothetical protein